MKKGTQSLIIGLLVASLIGLSVYSFVLTEPTEAPSVCDYGKCKYGCHEGTPNCKPKPYDGAINPNLGEAATINPNPYDTQSNSFAAISAVAMGVYTEDDNGNLKTKIEDSASYYGNTTTSVAVGNVIAILGGDSSYYLDPIQGFMVEDETFTLDMTGAAVANESEMQWTCYDDTGSTELSAGTNSSQEDYDIVLGADAEKTIYCKLKTNVADNAYDLGAICVGYMNDLDQLDLIRETKTDTDNPVGDNTWSSMTMPKHVADTELAAAEGAKTYKKCYQRASVLRLSEWDSVTLQFTIGCDATGCATTQTSASQDAAFVMAKDAAWAKDQFGYHKYGIADATVSEADVGMDETDNSPLGKSTGFVIEGISS